MNHRPKADAAKWLQGEHRTQSRRDLWYLLGYYGSSAVMGVMCGFLLGNGWSHQPITLAHDALLPDASTAAALTPPQVPVLDTVSTGDVPLATDTSPSPSPPSHRRPPVTVPSISPPDTSNQPHEPQAVQPAQEAVETLPPPAASQPPSPSDTTYIVQIGAFSQATNAAQVVSQLKKDGYAAGMLKSDKSDGDVLYRVYIARFSDESRAKAAAEAFRGSQKRDAYAVRY